MKIHKILFDHPRLTALVLLVTIALSVLATNLRQLRGKVDEYRQYWSMPQGAPGGLRYVALGDSAAQGIGASDPAHSYVSRIAERLQQASGRPVEIINISRSGARIRDVVRNQLPRLGALRADFVTVNVGGNDVTNWNPAEFTRNAIALCSGLASSKTVIADVPSFMHGKWRSRSRTAAEILTRACKAHGVTVAPLYATLESHGWRGMFVLYAADWFHPNDRGYEVWADTFWRAAMDSVQLRSTICSATDLRSSATLVAAPDTDDVCRPTRR